MKRIFIMCLSAAFMASCADVDLVETNYSEAVSNLKANLTEGSREVTLTWTNPAMQGLSGIRVIQNDNDVTDIDSVVSTYLIRKAPVNQDVAYTVKARYTDGRVSEGQTVRFNLAYEKKAATNTIALLVADDYTESADEQAAVKWFTETYVKQGRGVVIQPKTIDQLDHEQQAALWVMCDRVGVNLGWENLPGGLASNETVNALKTFAQDGGNLLLTNHATQLTVALGRLPEAYRPGIFGNGPGGQNPDTWGVQPIIGNAEGQIYDHSGDDIYAGMTFTSGLYERSIYCFEGAGVKGDHNCMWDLNAFGLAPEPNVVKAWEDATNSRVLGTWNHVVDYCCAGIVDFLPTTTFASRILAVGLASYEWDTEGTNPYQKELERFTSNCLTAISTPAEEKIALLVADDYTESADEQAAVKWFTETYVKQGRGLLLTPSTIDQLDHEVSPMLWVMCDRVGVNLGWENLPGGLASNETVNALKTFAQDGGNLLLTNHATQLTVALGRLPEAYRPGIFGNGPGGQNPDTWGVQPIIGNAEGQIYDHSGDDIYAGMTFTSGLYERSIYCFEGAGVKGDHNCMWDLNAFGLAPEPNVVKAWEDATNSRVLGTWNHVVDYCCAGIIDFLPTTTFASRILAVGLASYEWDTEGTNPYQKELEKFTKNCIRTLR